MGNKTSLNQAPLTKNEILSFCDHIPPIIAKPFNNDDVQALRKTPNVSNSTTSDISIYSASNSTASESYSSKQEDSANSNTAFCIVTPYVK